MSRVLVDTNVVLDVLLERHPHSIASGGVWKAIETGAAEGYLAAHAVTTIEYIVGRELGRSATRRVLSRILCVFRVAAVDHAVIQDALQFHENVVATIDRWMVGGERKGAKNAAAGDR